MKLRIFSTLASAAFVVVLASVANAGAPTYTSVACLDESGAAATCTLVSSATAGTDGIDITTDDTWCDGTALRGGSLNTMILDNVTFVQANLTILPGCIVRGQPRSASFSASTPFAGAPGVLFVTRQNGYLDAQGGAVNPIIMTTAAPDVNGDGVADDGDGNPSNGTNAWVAGNPFLDDTPTSNPLSPLDALGQQNVQLWGGLAIAGNAPTNLGDASGAGHPPCPTGASGDGPLGASDPDFEENYGEAVLEGSFGSRACFGGELPHDSSGIYRYISVRHAGDVVGPSNELNGVTLGGVGDATIFENIEVYTNQDDGIEYFGGTLNSKNLVISYVGDDGLDLDQGYNGSIQNVLIISTFFNQDSGADYGNGGSGDALGEWDGDDCTGDCNIQQDFAGGFDDVSWPIGAPAIYNLTGMGNVVNGATNPASSPNGANRGIRMRNNWQGLLANSIIVNTGAQECITDAAPSLDVPQQTQIVATSCSDTAAYSGTGGDVRGDRGVNLTQFDGADGTQDNYTGGAGTDQASLAASDILTQEDTYFEPKCGVTTSAVVNGKLDGCKATPIDPRPDSGAAAAEVANGIAPTGTGLDRSATYRGAFPENTPLWTDGWTALDAGDLL